MVADTADGSDGVVGSVLAYGRYPDGPRSQPPLAAEDNLDPEGAEQGLYPAQPTARELQIVRIDLATGAKQRLLNDALDPSISRDGTSCITTSSRTER